MGRLGIAAVLIVMGWTSPAFAGLVGVGVPEAAGGQLGGSAALGPEALLANPAAAVHEDGLFLDLGYILAGPTWTPTEVDPLTGQPPESVGYKGPTYNGSAALVLIPHDVVGLGLGLHFPFGRGGEYPDDGPQRFHSVASSFKVTQVTGAVAVQPVRGVRVGAGVHYIYATISGRVKTDLASTLYQIDPASAPAFGDPFLEGEAQLVSGSAKTMTWNLGAQVDAGPRVHLAASYQPAVPLQATGTSMIRPSDDVAFVAQGRFTYDLTLPWIARVGARWQMEDHVAFRLEVQRTGWSDFSEAHIRFHDMEATPDNDELGALLAVVGAGQIEEMLNIEKRSVRGMRNTWSGRLVGTFDLPRSWTLHTHVGWEQYSIAAEQASPGNIDWTSMFGGVSVERQLGERWRVYFTSTQYFGKPRVITTSALDQTLPADTGMSYPSGNGIYEVFFHRSGMGLSYRW